MNPEENFLPTFHPPHKHEKTYSSINICGSQSSYLSQSIRVILNGCTYVATVFYSSSELNFSLD